MGVTLEIPEFCNYKDYRIGERKRLSEPEKRRLEELIGGMSFEEQGFVASLLDHKILTGEIDRRLHDAKIKLAAVDKIFERGGRF